MAAAGLLLLRVVVGFVLVMHGAHELFGFFGDGGGGPGGLPATAAYFTQIGFTQGYALALVSGTLQLIGGFLIAIGLIARWASASLIGYYVLLIWLDRAKWGFFLNWTNDQTRGHGMEYAIVMIGVLLCFLLSGAGDWSLDGRRAQSRESRRAGRARLRNR